MYCSRSQEILLGLTERQTRAYAIRCDGMPFNPWQRWLTLLILTSHEAGVMFSMLWHQVIGALTEERTAKADSWHVQTAGQKTVAA